MEGLFLANTGYYDGAVTVGLFYFAGHGVQVNNQNYLIPLGSGIEEERQVTIKAVSAAFVLGQMEVTGNAMNFVFVHDNDQSHLKSGFFTDDFVILMPQGVVGALDDLYRRFKIRREA